MTVFEWITYAQARLSWTASPMLEAQLLAGHVMLVDRPWLLAHPDATFNELAGDRLLARREQREPLAYILGFREFYGRQFRVGPAVLIPRQETECLVEAALEFGDPSSAARVLDIGTGSGVIAVSLKLERPNWAMTALDVSADALEIAADNAQILGAEVRWVLSDRFQGLAPESFDLIVSNPPYIGEHENLPAEVRDFEPGIALFAGDHGDEFFAQLADQAADFLADRGRLMVEIGHSQSARVRKIFSKRDWTLREVHKDLSGLERVLVFGKSWASRLHYANAMNTEENPMDGKRRRVLVADDERHILRLIQLTLERHGYEVIVANDGTEALEKFRTEKPDIVVLDVMMPYMDGIEVLRAIRKSPEHRDVPVIMLTVKAQDAEVFEGYQHGADMYLTKPFNPMELLRFLGGSREPV